MTLPSLTRWNRAHQGRVRFVDGNAATHLEAVRQGLSARFIDWLEAAAEVPGDETHEEWRERLLAQYFADRRDYGWEISRTFARGLHVLTEHIDAFANESFLETATQWDSIRRLAAMIGYAPAPASSATTPLVLIAAEAGVIERGFGVKHTPTDGGPPATFETLEDIDVAPVLNGLRPAGWSRNPRLLDAAALFAPLPQTDAEALWLAGEADKLGAGDLAVLEHERTGDRRLLALRLRAVAEAGRRLALPVIGGVTPMTSGWAVLHLQPKTSHAPRLNGAGVVSFAAAHRFTVGDVAAWVKGGTTRFGRVTEVDALGIRVAAAENAPLPLPGESVWRAQAITSAQVQAAGDRWVVALHYQTPRSAGFRAIAAGEGPLGAGFGVPVLSEELQEDTSAGAAKFRDFSNLVPAGARTVWFADPINHAPAAVTAAGAPPNTLLFDGKPKDVASGDPVILARADGELSAARVLRIEAAADAWTMTLDAIPAGAPVAGVWCGFKSAVRPVGHDRDPTPWTAPILDLAVADLGEWPALAAPGRRLVAESESGAFAPFAARILEVDQARWSFSIQPIGDFPSGVRRGDLIVRANVVPAGHGETKPLKVLGSGDAVALNQTFLIEHTDISHVRDPSLPGGSRADIGIEIEGQRYAQVGSLRDSGPADPHYVVRPTESGTLQVTFGDGRRGRRLPTGLNNVTASLRRGAGLAGNLPPAALTEIARKHPAVSAVLQPVAASGGDEREALDQIRQNAPNGLVALSRAVSVSDYEALAEQFLGVWAAVAFPTTEGGRRELVRVVVVPAGGGPLGALREELTVFLQANSLPHVDVQLERFKDIPAELDLVLRVDAAQYDPDAVAVVARQALLDALDLRRRRPGQSLHRSELIAVIEGLAGVVNSEVTLFPTAAADWPPARRGDGGRIWAVEPPADSVIYASPSAVISVRTEAPIR